MYCQNWSPSVGLLEAYDGDQLFSFDFNQNTRVPRLPEFADWTQKPGDTSTIFFEKAFCRAMIQEIGPILEGHIPVSRGQGSFWGWGRGCILNLLHLYAELFPFTPAPSSNAFWVSPYQLCFCCGAKTCA